MQRLTKVVCVGCIAAAAAMGTIAHASAADDVAIVTPVLEVSGSGQTVGIPLLANVATSVIISSLPPEVAASDAGIALSGYPSEVAGQMVAANAQGLAAMKEAVSPLAAANEPLNALVDGIAETLDSTATLVHPLIQPFDTTAHQGATVLRGLKR